MAKTSFAVRVPGFESVKLTNGVRSSFLFRFFFTVSPRGLKLLLSELNGNFKAFAVRGAFFIKQNILRRRARIFVMNLCL